MGWDPSLGEQAASRSSSMPQRPLSSLGNSPERVPRSTRHTIGQGPGGSGMWEPGSLTVRGQGAYCCVKATHSFMISSLICSCEQVNSRHRHSESLGVHMEQISSNSSNSHQGSGHLNKPTEILCLIPFMYIYILKYRNNLIFTEKLQIEYTTHFYLSHLGAH